MVFTWISHTFHSVASRLVSLYKFSCLIYFPSFLKENPSPTKQQIEDSFDGNICRCTGDLALDISCVFNSLVIIHSFDLHVRLIKRFNII